MKRSKSYRPGMNGFTGGLSMQQLEDTLHHHLEPISYCYDEEETIMDGLESSLSCSSEDRLFAFSTTGTPKQQPTSRSMSSDDEFLFPMDQLDSPTQPQETFDDINRISPSSHTQAIAIPRARRSTTNEFDPSLPPLSARGDIQGAYFPNHEDPNSRIAVTHPFRPDAEMARRNSLEKAAESARAMFPDHSIPSSVEIGPDGKPQIPTGKYYPANWEKSHNQPPLPIPAELRSIVKRPANPSVTVRAITSPLNIGGPQMIARPISPSVPRPSTPSRRSYQGHSRTESEAKRLVQAYQRDMVVQASMGIIAASAGADMYQHHQRVNSLSPVAHRRPVSPRLEPLGSPVGPVTPMSLDPDEGSYLTMGLPMTPQDASLQAAEVKRAIQADRTKTRPHNRTNSTSLYWGSLNTGMKQMYF